MTFGELFRQVAIARGHPEDEGRFQYADSIAPSIINREVPAGMEEEFRAAFLLEAAKIDAMTQEERQAMLNKHIGKN